MIHNKALINDHGGDDGDDQAWVKIKFTHETVKDDGKPGVDSKKIVYGANLADPDKLGKALSYGTNAFYIRFLTLFLLISLIGTNFEFFFFNSVSTLNEPICLKSCVILLNSDDVISQI